MKISRKQFAAILRKYREKKGLSQTKLAKMIKGSNKTLCNYEHAICFPSSKKIEKIVKVLEIPSSELNISKTLDAKKDIKKGSAKNASSKPKKHKRKTSIRISKKRYT